MTPFNLAIHRAFQYFVCLLAVVQMALALGVVYLVSIGWPINLGYAALAALGVVLCAWVDVRLETQIRNRYWESLKK